MTGPRVRIAPSPTGAFHVGSARTALFNWLVARQQGGRFILRIEDTDAERDREEWVEGIVSALGWLGLDWDEGPFRQSERGELYQEAARRLFAGAAAYWCDCTRQQVAERAGASAGGGGPVGGGGPTGYDGHCRERGLAPGPGRALRFKVGAPGATVVSDLVRGEVSFDNRTIEDFVLLKASGAPLFLLANVVDDLDMAINLVIRGEDHLSNTPKYLLVWRALGQGAEPVFAHLPMLVNSRGQKLSKRRDPVALESYRQQGYLADAMVNYLALLGWGPGGEGGEVLSRDQLVARFDLAAVKPSPAFFDPVKLRHFNGVYIRAMAIESFVEACAPWLATGPWPPERFDAAVFAYLAPLVRERVATLGEVASMVDFVFLEAPVIDTAAWKKVMVEDRKVAAEILDRATAAFSGCAWEPESLKHATLGVGEAVGRKLSRAQAPIRVAVTGRDVGLPLFESLVALGRETTRGRLAAAAALLAAGE